MKKGYLIVNVYSDTIANPISNATVKVQIDNSIIKEEVTDSSGKTASIELETKDKNYSLNENSNITPYIAYRIEVTALGLIPKIIENIPIFENITSIQDIYLNTLEENSQVESITLTPNSLLEDDNYYEENNSNNEISTYVLNKVVIPENIIVHDGIPSNNSAANYTVPFIEYIKNVASSEIYPTWPTEALKANILSIISFTLNRIYTEWYLSKGYDFTITSSTTYDQKYTRSGVIYNTISTIVDEVFNKYIRYSIRLEPLLAHYKNSTTEAGYLSQWGTKDLATQGKNYLEILKYYYGDNISIEKSPVESNYPYSYTKELKLNDCGKDVYTLENILNYIHSSYPLIPLITKPSGKFTEDVEESVKIFQKVFNLETSGIVDYKTWYKISYIFIAVSKMTNSIY
jgi:hypothetical protein